eukprot:scaffold3121_cov211-Skeletonema_marinoi.AAC.2
MYSDGGRDVSVSEVKQSRADKDDDESAELTQPLPLSFISELFCWQMILDAYNIEVDSSYKFDEIVPPTQGYLFDKINVRYYYNNEGAPPFCAKSTNMGMHRGLFASREGAWWHRFGRSIVFFLMQWRIDSLFFLCHEKQLVISPSGLGRSDSDLSRSVGH